MTQRLIPRSASSTVARPDGWWAESPEVDGWSAAGDTYAQVVRLAEEGIPLALGHDAALERRSRAP